MEDQLSRRVNKEFLKTSGEYGEFDNLEFVTTL